MAAIAPRIGQNPTYSDGLPHDNAQDASHKTYAAAERIDTLSQDWLKGKYKGTFKAEVFEGGFGQAWEALLKDNYVRNQWSANYYVDTLSASFTGLKGSITHFEGRQFVKVLGKTLWYAEVANFFKGMLGIVGTIPRLGKHALLTAAYAVGLALSPLICIVLACIDKKLAVKFLKEVSLGFFGNLAHMLKDAATMIACAGHMVAFWVPIVIALIPCPGTSVAAAAVFAGMLSGFASLSKMPGVFDIMGNVGTAVLLNMEKAFLSWEIQNTDNEKQNQLKEELESLNKEFVRLKEGLDPTTFGGYMTWLMMVSSFIGLIIYFIPGAGPALAAVAKELPSFIPTTFLIEYGMATVPTAALTAVVKVYRKVNHRKDQLKNSQPKQENQPLSLLKRSRSLSVLRTDQVHPILRTYFPPRLPRSASAPNLVENHPRKKHPHHPNQLGTGLPSVEEAAS